VAASLEADVSAAERANACAARLAASLELLVSLVERASCW